MLSAMICSPPRFQSTLPVWGATLGPPEPQIGLPISIHAPRVGSDTSPQSAEIVQLEFQSTLPVWGATDWDAQLCRTQEISIHAPRVGSDMRLHFFLYLGSISIHAPRVGSDLGCLAQSVQLLDFNPRSPCGERPKEMEMLDAKDYFNPRSPCGERLKRALLGDHEAAKISIHAPRVGSDPPSRPAFKYFSNFNPRSPCGERRDLCLVYKPSF